MSLPLSIIDDGAAMSMGDMLSPLIHSEPSTPTKMLNPVVHSEPSSPTQTPNPVTHPEPAPTTTPGGPVSDPLLSPGTDIWRLSPSTKSAHKLGSPYPAKVSKPLRRSPRSPSLVYTPWSDVTEPSLPTVKNFNRRAVVTNPNKKNFDAIQVTGYRLRRSQIELNITWEDCWVSERMYQTKVRVASDNHNVDAEESEENAARFWHAAKVLQVHSDGKYKAYYMKWEPQWTPIAGVSGGLLFDYLQRSHPQARQLDYITGANEDTN
ncbi:hypothetical protein TWF718_009702 [Orbilia javanica]|uniref:Chromo domain-containing protein n=1 Tax=Orbilia javanica TaxID=47235 RepID=A0AAN8MWM8_9PEZI